MCVCVCVCLLTMYRGIYPDAPGRVKVYGGLGSLSGHIHDSMQLVRVTLAFGRDKSLVCLPAS